MPRLLILAGPNGAGKTTFAYSRLKEAVDGGSFLNADETARDIDPSNVEAAAVAAGRAVIDRRRALIAERRSFVVETTLASRTFLRTLDQAGSLGYERVLYFLFVSSSSLCQFRVKQRVMKGGHNIPDDVVHRRHALGLVLLPRYVAACDSVDVLHADAEPVPVFEKRGSSRTVCDAARFDLLNALIRMAGGEAVVA